MREIIRELHETIKGYGLWYTVYEELLPMWRVRFKVKRWKPILVLWAEWKEYSRMMWSAEFLEIDDYTIEGFKEYLIKNGTMGKRLP